MPPEGSDECVGVALLQMGGPASTDELGPFLRNLFCDPEMIRLPPWLAPFQPVLGRLYATWRTPRVRPDYEAIGYSNILATTRSLGQAVETRLNGRGAPVRVAMRYTEPRARAALASLAEAGAERLVTLPLYPFYSHATTGSSILDFEDAARAEGFDGELLPIEAWGNHPGFLELTAAWTRRTVEQAGPEELGSVAILLSTHGIPQAYVDAGDPYEAQVRQAAGQLGKLLEDVAPVTLTFQSDVGPVEWLRPYVPEAIDTLAADGVDTLVIVPFGFVSEHIETLYEIDVEYTDHAHEAGIDRVLRVPTFDDAPAFAELLARVLEARLEGAA